MRRTDGFHSLPVYDMSKICKALSIDLQLNVSYRKSSSCAKIKAVDPHIVIWYQKQRRRTNPFPAAMGPSTRGILFVSGCVSSALSLVRLARAFISTSPPSQLYNNTCSASCTWSNISRGNDDRSHSFIHRDVQSPFTVARLLRHHRQHLPRRWRTAHCFCRIQRHCLLFDLCHDPMAGTNIHQSWVKGEGHEQGA